MLYPGFELGTAEINGVSYRTLTAGNDCVITDNGNVYLSPYENDYSRVYSFTLKNNGICYTEILRTPIGGYTSGNYASKVPRVLLTDVTEDGADDIVIRAEDYDKDDGSTRCDIFVYDCEKETSVRIPVSDIKNMLVCKYISDKMTLEDKAAHTRISCVNGAGVADFDYEMPEKSESVSEITVIRNSDYLCVRDGVIYCGVYIDYEDGYYLVTGNYTTYASALYVPLVYDADSLFFVAGDEEDIVLVPAKTTWNYAAKR